MKKMSRTRLGVMAFVTAAALGLTACGGDASGDGAGDAEATTTESAAAEGGEAASDVTDMSGNTVELPADPQSIVATDNRIFGTLADWGVELTAAPVDLMPENDQLAAYHENSDIVNLGNHREPDMEGVVAVEPDLILNGQRFTQYAEDLQELAPDAAFVDTNIDIEANPLDEQLRELTTLLGEVFGQRDSAEQLIADFDESIERAQAAYNEEWTVAGLITTGGDINYSAPSTGRAVGPVFDVLDLTPALEQDGSTNHQGDDISVEAIADANPEWLIVLDRDAGTGDAQANSAEELLEESEALQNVPAIQEGNIVYLNPDFYTAEDIQHYTELFNDLADAFEAAS